jgi:hypothetical protein
MPSWFYSCYCEKTAYRHHGAFIRLFPGMGTMKHGPDAMEGNTHSGASSLAEFCAAGAQQTLNIDPRDIRSNRILKNGV